MPAQDEFYDRAIADFGQGINRLARAWEADPEVRKDLLQEIHLAIWRSFNSFDGHCSLRTWVYRVAHNIATSHVIRSRRVKSANLVAIEDIEDAGCLPASHNTVVSAERNQQLEQLLAMIQRLKPLDRQVILLYLEGMDAASIGEATGISPTYTATKIHRIKAILAERFRNGDSNDRK